jgi:hypothetical protein
MADSSQVGDIGTKILLDCVEDLTGFTSGKIKYIKPSGEPGEWTAVRDGTGIYYITVTVDDLDEEGNWCIQSYVEIGTPTTWAGHGEMTKFVVNSNG